MTRWLLILVLGMTLAGCQARQADAAPAEYRLNEAFALGGGQQASISGEDLSLRFTDVLEDSRCPTQVDCVWTGQARIAVLVQGENPPTTVEFNTNPAPGQNRQTVATGKYAIRFQSLDPYPQTPDESIALADYTATLSVHMTSS